MKIPFILSLLTVINVTHLNAMEQAPAGASNLAQKRPAQLLLPPIAQILAAASQEPRQTKKMKAQVALLCPVAGCDNVFNAIKTLEDHLFYHSGIRPYKCRGQGCQGSFRSKQAAQSHSITIHGLNLSANTPNYIYKYPAPSDEVRKYFPYPCPTCNQSFASSESLQKHIIAKNKNPMHNTPLPLNIDALLKSKAQAGIPQMAGALALPQHATIVANVAAAKPTYPTAKWHVVNMAPQLNSPQIPQQLQLEKLETAPATADELRQNAVAALLLLKSDPSGHKKY